LIYLINHTWRGGEAVTQGSAKPPCAGSIPARASFFMEREGRKNKHKSKCETGFSEKQIDIDAETGIFKKTGVFKKKKIKKILFEKKAKK
jgi:hypothetical protein